MILLLVGPFIRNREIKAMYINKGIYVKHSKIFIVS